MADTLVRLTLELPEPQALALAQLAKRFTFEDAERRANAFDGGRERDAMIDGISTLRRALADAGFEPR